MDQSDQSAPSASACMPISDLAARARRCATGCCTRAGSSAGAASASSPTAASTPGGRTGG
eukprot:4882186-Pyramimonas_sp.AAC.1